MIRACTVAVALLSTAATAFAQDIGDARCKNPDFVARSVGKILQSAQSVADAVPLVPPAEAEYVRREKQAALRQGSVNRFDLLTSSPHYWALEFHDDYKVFSDNLIAAEKARSTKEQARYLVVSLSRLVDLKSSLYAYVDFDKNSRRGIVSEEMRRRIYFAIPVARSELTSVLQCAISQL